MVENPDLLLLGGERKNILDGRLSTIQGKLVADLNLQEFGASCAHYGLSSFIAAVLATPLTREEDIHNQRSTIDELAQEENYATLDSLLERMRSLEAHLKGDGHYYIPLKQRVSRKLTTLQEYEQLLDDLENAFEGATSPILQSIPHFAREIRDSEEARLLSDIVEQGINHQTVHVDIMYDAGNIPRRIRLSKPEKKPPLQGLLRHIRERVKKGNRSARDKYEFMLMGLSDYIERNMTHIDQIFSMRNDLLFYCAMINYETALKEKISPQIPTFGDETTIKGMRHPFKLVLDAEVVPNDYVSSPKKRICVITGANDSGKSYYAKVRAFNQLLIQRGLLPAADSAHVRIVDGVYTHFVKEDNLLEDMGLYKTDLANLSQLLDVITPRSLIVLDEPCRGTETSAGLEKSSEILEGLNHIGVEAVFTTHHHDLPRKARKLDGVYFAHPKAKLVGKDILYDRKIEEGPAGTSLGYEFAETVGMGKEDIMKKAREAKIR